MVDGDPTARPRSASLPGSRLAFARLRRVAARVPTYFADAVDNPEWLVMFALGRLLPVRRAYRTLHPLGPAAPLAGPTLFGDADVAAIAAAVACDGIFQGLALPATSVQEIHDFALATPCFGNMERRLDFLAPEHAAAESRFGQPLLTGHYFERVEACAALAAVRADPLLQAAASACLGPQARLAATRLWWSFPTRPREQDLHRASQERFHFDLDDWQTLKFFFYLTPVDAGSGPHVYLRGSHSRRLWRHQLTLLVGQPNAAVLAGYGAGNVLTVTGPAGFGFVEDPFGFHMGTAPRRRARLMLEIAFGVSAASKRRCYGEPVIG
jgi:hypothetical protein